MKKALLIILLALFMPPVLANALSICDHFTGKSGCFLLFDQNQSSLLTQYNPARCAQRLSPNSTFKIPLSLMAFDQKLISQKSIFKWDNKDKGLAVWNQHQTPRTWLENSTVWVSQDLVTKLGQNNIKNYLGKFNYGNQDNKLPNFWLDSSLTISAEEQLTFMKALVANKLPVSKEAMLNTKENMYLETSPHGWKLYGKTGSGKQQGWFVGFIEKANQVYVFVLNFSDIQAPTTSDAAGPRAKEITKALLTKMDLF
nr:ClassD_beta_lactamase [uncultured bacterium]